MNIIKFHQIICRQSMHCGQINAFFRNLYYACIRASQYIIVTHNPIINDYPKLRLKQTMFKPISTCYAKLVLFTKMRSG